jgi:integrase
LRKFIKNKQKRGNHYELPNNTNILADSWGVPLKTISARTGHSTIKFTADIYAHMIQSSDRAAADKLGEILG